MISLGWVASRCLQAPPHPLACSRCLDACPTEALAFQEHDDGVSPLASDACHGCAQCVAACPSEALVSAEIDALMTGQAQGEPIGLGCHRVTDQKDLTRLHCLRALGPDLLAWLTARAAPGAVTLMLPASCRDCEAAEPAEQDGWLEQAQTFCHISEANAGEDYRAARTAVSRRDLLRGRPAPRPPAIAAEDAAPKARRVQRQQAAAEALKETRAAPALPGLSLDADACRAHGVCARVCPTEALQETQEGDLNFDPLACLDCGHCLSACPEGALTRTEGSQTAAVTLRQGQRIDCRSCGRPFTPVDGELRRDAAETLSTCPACRREAALMEESFHELFG
ncbi:MAG: 4Fe-4S binding protein [Halomonas sp.]|uniref:4Fe-4S dicluster domain-containing protein n=1 Tax=Halomonas sp. TaxID=1486246 RepID=UPI002ACEEFE0|nr:4Fe-4S dicluster domain-containing protein [Halomonas sp.]MDZ7852431.1 4Fe-4S binding protein [Halomonas sp.]